MNLSNVAELTSVGSDVILVWLKVEDYFIKEQIFSLKMRNRETITPFRVLLSNLRRVLILKLKYSLSWEVLNGRNFNLDLQW